jgi:hypothetical protein
MKGAGYYDLHSDAQRSSIQDLQAWVDDAVASLPLPCPARPVTVLDLGSSEGGNATRLLGAIVAGLRRRTDQPLQTICSDLASNDFLLKHLQAADWHALEADLWTASCEAYEVPIEQCRLDATTSFGYHTVEEGGLMQYGHSKDHRPDLPQLKLMAAAAFPAGQVLAADFVPDNSADDPLYVPLIRRVRKQLGRRGLLYSGDCKMGAPGHPRGHRQARWSSCSVSDCVSDFGPG